MSDLQQQVWWVWAESPDNAVEELWECKEYRTLEEALRKDPEVLEVRLFRVEVCEQEVVR